MNESAISIRMSKTNEFNDKAIKIKDNTTTMMHQNILK